MTLPAETQSRSGTNRKKTQSDHSISPVHLHYCCMVNRHLLLLLFNQVIRMYTCTGILRTKNNTSWRIAHIFPCSPMFPNVCRYRDYGEWESYPSCTQDHNNTTVKWHVSPSIIHSSKRNKPIRKSFKRK